jgi:hypothetical protein
MRIIPDIRFAPMRLCRLMCGKSLTFRWALFKGFGALPRIVQAVRTGGIAPQCFWGSERKVRDFPHIRRHSRSRARINA